MLHLLLLLLIGGDVGAAAIAPKNAWHGWVCREYPDGVVLLAALAQQRFGHWHLLGDGSAILLLLLLLLLPLLLFLLQRGSMRHAHIARVVLSLALLAADGVQLQLALPVSQTVEMRCKQTLLDWCDAAGDVR